LPQTRTKPFHKTPEYAKIRKIVQNLGEPLSSKVHVCFYAAPFGLIPLELDEVYPLSQHEVALPLEKETIDYVAKHVSDYIMQTRYESIVLLNDPQQWGSSIKKYCSRSCLKKGIKFEHVNIRAEGSKNILTRLEMILRKHLSEDFANFVAAENRRRLFSAIARL
jgi:predicted RNA-binding protein